MLRNFPKQFNNQESKHIESYIRNRNEIFWERVRETKILQLFHLAARKVPAYRDFLKKQKIIHEKIKNLQDFSYVPVINKKNYLSQYPLDQLIWGGNFSKQLVFTSTSGSTGAPSYFPRSTQLDWESSIIHELFLKNGLTNKRQSTLVIVGFGMGVWIGGLITYKAFEIAAQRGKYNVSIITPGINKAEIFHALRNLSPCFDRTILTGYPPFIKDIVDEARENDIDLKKLKIRLLFAAESFTEKFRDYISKKAGIINPYLDTMNIYGTADMGTMAYETPTAILVKRLAISNKNLFHSIFGDTNKNPTLAQYNPFFANFECEDNAILLTGNNEIPLIRYSLGDHGGAASYGQIANKLSQYNFNIEKSASQFSLGKQLYHLPFVYVYERSDFMVKLHLHEIHPEIIRDTLISPKVNKYLTGKFTMSTKYGSKQDQYLELNIELKKGVKPNNTFQDIINRKIIHALKTKAHGPGSPHELIKKPGLVKIIFWPAEDPTYFRPGVKQKWAISH